jgi:nitroimidazol reductase NimA-like FMN-containing flavoprotein (pyridoxamine 5'-phosphate oxidase superfamily)
MKNSHAIQKRLKALFENQHLAVLSTEQNGQPYASLIAFAVSDDLKHLYFVTPQTTRKFENLAANPRVALLVNDSENREDDFHKAVAATIVGQAEVLDSDESEMVQKTYLERHPHLADFVASPTSALIRVNIRSFYLVRRFQQVTELHLTS